MEKGQHRRQRQEGVGRTESDLEGLTCECGDLQGVRQLLSWEGEREMDEPLAMPTACIASSHD